MAEITKAGSKMETLYKAMGEMRDSTKESTAEVWTDQLAKVKGMFSQMSDKSEGKGFKATFFDMTSIVGQVDLSRGDKKCVTCPP